jgi:hypothetical protein
MFTIKLIIAAVVVLGGLLVSNVSPDAPATSAFPGVPGAAHYSNVSMDAVMQAMSH